jgi:hypothetical protein
MAISMGTRFRLGMGEVFPAGAYLLGVEPDNDFERARSGSGDAQKRDKDTGERLWLVTVLDADPDARAREVKVRIAAPHQPVPPQAAAGSPFVAVEFDGLTAMPWVDGARCERRKPHERECRGRVAYSLRAASMRAPGKPANVPTATKHGGAA